MFSKITKKWTKDLNITTKNIKLKKEKTVDNPHDCEFSNGFSDMTSNTGTTNKRHKFLDFIKI